MAGSFQSIFNRQSADAPQAPSPQAASPQSHSNEKLLMRPLEPRVLLDAAAVETALDVAGQSAHSQLADDYMESSQSAVEGNNDAGTEGKTPNTDEIAESIAASPRRTDREIVFVDSAIEDREGLIASLEPGVSVHVINAESDGLQQIADILADSGGYDAIHIFSHGSQGALQLGDGVLTANSIAGTHAEALGLIGEALGESGDILIYGCNFGEGELGKRAAGLLAAATGADVAASDDLTGSESLAGDWDLEIQHGLVEARAFSLPDWQGILPGYELQATTDPTIGHLDNGIVGTANTTATWSDAVVYDPGGGGPIQTYDIRATLIGLSDGMSATFETVASTDGSMDDFRVVVTNIGEVVGSAGGQDIVEEGTVSVSWAIYEAGTDTLAPPDQFDLIFKDIEGLAGLPDTRETVAVQSEEIVSYTVNAGSDLQVTSEFDGLAATGTQLGTGAVGSDLGLSWVSANQFIVTYTSRTLITNFDMDGDRDMSAFPTPETTKTQLIDLNGAAAGEDYLTTYINGSQLGSDEDVPLELTAVDMSIFDFDGEFLYSATVRLTNASVGDDINFDTVLLDALGITASYTDTGTERILDLSGFALISNYETALQSITYSNSNPDASFDRVTDRVFEFTVYDGVLNSDIARTTVQFAEAVDAPVAGSNVYVEDEDTTIVANVASGLLSNDFDPQGTGLTIIGALDSDSNPITIGAAHTMPSGASLTLNSNGSFTYIPALHYSGNESITYSISDGVNSASGTATFDIQPVIDPVTLTIVQPDDISAEDVASDPIDVSSMSDDPSEQQIVLATSIPDGVVLTDGVNSFTAGDGIFETDITGWDRTQLRVLPVQNSDEDIDITFVTENYEVDGSVSFDSQTVTFQIDAVADVPILIVEQAFGDIDESVPLGTVISVDLFDTDGSEAITDITISGIPAGASLTSDSGPITIVGGVASFALIDLPGLIFHPPITGADATYNMSVSATSTEVAPENGVQQLNATRFGVGLTIELNDNDNPVVAVDDVASTFAGESVSIPVLDNDFIPDGAPLITHVNGIPIDTITPVTLPGGQGEVELSPFGYLVFNASDTFAGEVKFSYTAQDVDFSTDVGIVTVSVEPRWKLSSVPNVEEGNDARFVLEIEGGVAQGDVISAEVILEDGTADAADHATLADAINASIINLDQNDFSFDGTNVTYTSPATNYTVDYDAAAGTFTDISASGEALNLADDSIAGRSLGFEFKFYADTFNSVYVSANGYLTFGSPGADANNAQLDGTALAGRPIIAPFWDDLDTAAGNVYVETIGSVEGQRQYIIQWEGIENNSDGSGTGSFQVILDEASNDIVFNYRDVIFDGVGDEGAGATIGLQSPDGISDEFSFDTGGNIVDGSSITFTHEANIGVELYIDIPIVDDTDFEDVEDFGLRIVSSVNSAIGVDNADVTIAVSDNSSPVAADDALATTETSSALINVITNPGGLDTDPEGHALTISELDGVVITGGTAVTLASGATVGVNPNGSLTYNPNGAFAYLEEGEMGVDTFTYKVVDAYGTESPVPATVTVNITGENQTAIIDLDDDGTTSNTTHNVTYGPLETTMNVTAPDAVIIDVDDTELSSISITLGGFMQPGNEKLRTGGLVIEYGTALNATKSQGGTLFRIIYDGANDIQITNNFGPEFAVADAQDLIRGLLYENDSSDDTRGTRTLTFVATDDDGPGAPAVSEIYVVGNNVPPVAGDDGVPTPYQTFEDTSILITVAELLANDTDVDLNPLDIVAVNGGPNGGAVLDGFGNVVYTPSADYTGSTFFTYTVDDGDGGQDTGTVYVDVTPVNDAPRIDLNGLQAGIDRSITYTENDPPTSMFLLTGTLIDVDNANLTGAEMILTGGQIDDVFNFGTLPAGITATIVPAEGAVGLTAPGMVTIQFSGTASVADYETALRSVGFSNNSDIPDASTRTVTVTATDGALTSLVATATIDVVQVNDLPDTVDDGLFTFDEDTSITIAPATLLANDFDRDGEDLTIISVQSPVNGTVITNGDGDFVFTADPNYFGPASFTYTAQDESGGTSVQIVNLMVTSVNDEPVITLDTGSGDGNYAFSYTENDPATVIVSGTLNIQDIDHSNLSSATVTLTNGQIGDLMEHGTLPGGITATIVPPTALTSPGTITVTLSGSASLADYETALQLVTYRSVSEAPSVVNRSITISVNDGMDDSNVGTTTITVIAVNDAPVAVDDNALTLNEDVDRVILPAELLGNDYDPDIEPVTIVSVQSAINGTVILNGDGTVTFTPPPDYFGPASFTYTIEDADNVQDTATVNLTINSVNDLPVVDLDTGAGGSGYATGYVENAPAVPIVDASVQISDVDNTILTGATIVLTDGQIGDILNVGSLPAGITAIVTPSTNLTSPGTISVQLSGIANAADYQAALQAITFESNSDRPGATPRTVSITVNDGTVDSVASIATINVTPVNDVPVANPDGTFTLNEDETFVVPETTLLANDTDADLDVLSIVSVQGAVNGTVALDGFGNVVFTPTPAYSGPASFTYTAEDASGATDTTTVTLNILILNDAPEVDLDLSAAGTGYSTSYTENSAGIAIVDSDVSITDEDHVTAAAATITLTNGQVGDILEVGGLPGSISASVVPATALTSPGTVTVTLTGIAPLADYQAAFQALTYRSTSEDPNIADRVIEFVVSDGEDDSSVETTTIAVTSVNDAPNALDDGVPTPIAVTEDVPVTFNPVSSNDFDFENDTLTITEINGSAIAPGGFVNIANGRVDLAIDGTTLTYTPNPNYFGAEIFTYTLSDGALTDTATVNLDVASVNDAPVAVDDGPIVLVEDGFILFDPVLSNDTDVEGDALSIQMIDGQAIAPTGSVSIASGTISLAADGRTIQYVPNPNFNGIAVVSYEITDGSATATANVTFDVTAVDDPITLVTTPPDVAFNDSDPVNLPMAGYFDDPDNDTLVYSISGLPTGLSFDPATGLISGVLNSSASQGSPYAITVSVDDGVSSIVSTGFTLDVLNIAPVALADQTVVVFEGNALNIDGSALFSDADNDTLTYVATGLPAWAFFDTASGLISGTIPSDASVAGAFTVTINADDGDGGVATIDVTIDPRNVAPVATDTIDDLVLGEEDPVDIDIGGLFVDGGLDSDPIAITVTGLPDGVNFDPVLERISGAVAAGASSQGTYLVTVSADDGQGGITQITFDIRVGNNALIEEESPLDQFDDPVDTGEEDADEKVIDDPLTQAIDEIAELNSTIDLSRDTGIILSAVEGIEPLHEATLSGSEAGLPDQIDAMDRMAQSTDWLRESGREGNGDWNVAGTFGYMALTDDIHLVDGDSSDERLHRLIIEAEAREGALYIQLNNQLDPDRDGRVVTTTFSYAGGQELPEWMKLLREGFISATPPEDISEFSLELSIILETGKDLIKRVKIDVASGAVLEVSDDQNEVPVENAETGDGAKDKSSVNDLELGNIRGTLELREPHG